MATGGLCFTRRMSRNGRAFRAYASLGTLWTGTSSLPLATTYWRPHASRTIPGEEGAALREHIEAHPSESGKRAWCKGGTRSAKPACFRTGTRRDIPPSPFGRVPYRHLRNVTCGSFGSGDAMQAKHLGRGAHAVAQLRCFVDLLAE